MSNLIITQKILPWGKIEVYPDRIVIVGAMGLNNKAYPINNISDIAYNKITQKLTIKTNSGEEKSIIIAGSAKEVHDAISGQFDK